MKRSCASCRREIPEGVHPYTLRLELFPAVEDTLTIRPEEMDQDFDAELKRLIEMMEGMNEDEVAEQEKKVYVRHSYTLCPACRDRLARELERLGPG